MELRHLFHVSISETIFSVLKEKILFYVRSTLIQFCFQPDEVDDYEHEGFVERSRRASGIEGEPDEEPTYTLYNLGGAPCIFAQTECTFNLDYHTLRYGVQTVTVQLPQEPKISGSCVREGDTAVLTMRWSVFNFSLIFTENPEGNSYYLNKAILKYNQTLDIFRDATYRGPVILQTQKGWNYYFTPLGRSYVCKHGEDQGPLDLYNLDAEIVGNMTLYDTKFQPFVKRAKGIWGPEDHCLPKAIQVMREDVVPFVVSGIFLSSVVLLVAGYALYRKLNVKKADYGFYGENGPPDGSGGGDFFGEGEERMEMQERQQPARMTSIEQPVELEGNGHSAATNGANGASTAPTAAANPFKNKPSSNPFNQ